MISKAGRRVFQWMVVPMRVGKQSSLGFILLGMLVLMLIAGYALAECAAKWQDSVRREREQELLKIGDTIRKAIGSYYQLTPGVVKQYPPNLEALLHDDRFPMPQRYLRKLYIDPITQQANWGLLQAPSGGVMGIYSLSHDKPFKTHNFSFPYQSFENLKAYESWYFVYVPKS